MAWDWSSVRSLLGTLLFLRTAIRDFFPEELRRCLRSLFRRLLTRLDPETTIIIHEYDGSTVDELHNAAEVYLGHHCVADAATVRLFMDRGSSRPIALLLPDCHTTNDTFRGIPLRWSSDIGRSSTKASKKQRHLKLSFPRQHRHVVSSFYMPHILKEAESICLMTRERRLYTNTHANDDYRFWCPAPFAHPSNLDTLAIDPTLRDDIRADLLRFVGRQDYYARVGRRWKRSYLLYGPPGTGKTSLVAAIANFLEFDVFHIDLTAVDSNLELHRLLDSTTPGSVIVVEDIDCSLDLGDRMEETEYDGAEGTTILSCVLDFMDGLWTSSEGERLVIFTTNHPERLDPALLRPGRMDRHIHLSYCCPAAFRVLARNYLEVEEHELMAEAEALLGEVNMTPAEIAEVFMGCDGDDAGADTAMQKVVGELRQRQKRLQEAVSFDDGDTSALGAGDE
ncbi:ATPase family associated with various cellular activities (AAA) [Musa troglodytarum]|uniref:ATPase family associated with various cellular activities (AAA) n=2 Tax=Musa troglodytarum TaxID=320322 RepID=A0A9E7HH24_9LILI|nr:ATPase family associated with various cellular activities (AAA) [Musa troglodytarum]